VRWRRRGDWCRAMDVWLLPQAQVMEREKTKRHKTVLIDGVVMIAGSVYILLVNGNLVGFLQLLADGLAAWTGVVSSTRPREN